MSIQAIHPAQSSSSSASFKAGDRKLGGGSGGAGGGGSSRRTRVTPKDITANACIQCKKARAKCDVKQPCYRCFQRNEGSACEYRVHVKMAKEEILERFNQLAQQYRWAHRLMKALISDNHAPEIVERLKRGEDYGSVARSFDESQLRPLPASSGLEAAGGGDDDGQEAAGSSSSMDYEVGSVADRVSRTILRADERAWTRVTHDTGLVEHLLDLYFTWVHPVHMVFSEPHFRTSFASHDRVHCSAALVNVMCAMACHLLEPSAVEVSDRGLVSARALGDRFMDEGRSLIKPEDHVRLTTVQAFAVMFLAEVASGKALKASAYIRFANGSLTNGLARQEIHRDAWLITLWGVHSLNVAWSAFSFERSERPELVDGKVLEGVRLERDEGVWRLYRQTEDLQAPVRPGLGLLVAYESARFLQRVRDTNDLFYDDGAPLVSARDLLLQYRRYTDWREELAAPVARMESDEAPLPHVMLLLAHYHAAMVLLFRPLVGLSRLPRGGSVDPEVIGLGHAVDGLSMLSRYRGIYTCRHQPHLQVLCVLHLSDFVVRFGESAQAQRAAVFCLEALKECRAGLAVCGPLQELFRRTLVECGVPLPDDMAALMQPSKDFCLDEILDACTRLSYVQPVQQIRRRLSPSLADEWEREAAQLVVSWTTPTSSTSSTEPAASGSRRQGGGSEKLMRIRSILNQ